MLSKSAEYAIRSTWCLSSLARDEPVPASELAERVGVPENYLSKLLHRLQQAGVVDSRRGRRGGFTLARAPSEITLANIVEPFDPDLLHRPCLLGRPECRDDAPCLAHEGWMKAAGSVRRFLQETTLEELGPAGVSRGCAPAAVDGGREDELAGADGTRGSRTG